MVKNVQQKQIAVCLQQKRKFGISKGGSCGPAIWKHVGQTAAWLRLTRGAARQTSTFDISILDKYFSRQKIVTLSAFPSK